MSNWSDLPLDLVKEEIANRMDFYEDVLAFGGICTSWRSTIKHTEKRTSPRQMPWLMLAEWSRTNKRRFLSLYNGMVREVELPTPPSSNKNDDMGLSLRALFSDDEGERRYLSSRGWLICVAQYDTSITLIDPFSGTLIQPPAICSSIIRKNLWERWNARKDLYRVLFVRFTISQAPRVSSDYSLAMVFSQNRNLAVWNSGDDEWTVLSDEFGVNYMDIEFYKGELYGVDSDGDIMAFDHHLKIEEIRQNQRLVARINHDYGNIFPGTFYLMESRGVLLVVYRAPHIDSDDEWGFRPYFTVFFKVWEVNVDNGEVKEVTNLGNRSLFVGLNSSFSIEATPPYCKPNCIYYTDDYVMYYSEFSHVGGLDMGVYDLSCGLKIEDFYRGPSRFSSITPPLWLEIPSTIYL